MRTSGPAAAPGWITAAVFVAKALVVVMEGSGVALIATGRWLGRLPAEIRDVYRRLPEWAQPIAIGLAVSGVLLSTFGLIRLALISR